MRTIRIIYWVATGLIALMMSFSAYAYLTQPAVQQGIRHLGFPDYFRIELAIAKLIGVIVLLAPLAARYKEWAYAGFAIVFISAFIAHVASGDPVTNRIMPFVAMVLLVVSYLYYHKKSKTARPSSSVYEAV